MSLKHLANALKDGYDSLEVADMEDREDQSHVAEVAVAHLEGQIAGSTLSTLVRYTHSRIEWAIFLDCALVFEVEQSPVGNFD